MDRYNDFFSSNTLSQTHSNAHPCIYLDNSATTQVLPETIEYISDIMQNKYGNPAGIHNIASSAEKIVNDAKLTFSKILKVKPSELFFTSGGTESDNLALIGCALANRRFGNHIITSSIEHSAVKNACKYLESIGFNITYLSVDSHGCINTKELSNALRPSTIIVSIMHTNNEVGTMQPLAKIGSIIKKYNSNIIFHSDAVQGFGKAYIYPKELKLDLMSASSHKVHGPKGCGLLYVAENVKIMPLMFGGNQQESLRPGTINVPGIAGMAYSSMLLYEYLDIDVKKLLYLRNHLVNFLSRYPRVKINSPIYVKKYDAVNSAPHIVNISVDGISGYSLVKALNEKGVYTSTGSACSAKLKKPSETLLAMNKSRETALSSVRFSLSILNTLEEIEYVEHILAQYVLS